MLLPFETSFSAWFAGTPQYEWEPLESPPPACAPEGEGAAANGVDASPVTPPTLRLVFKGVAWTAQYVCWSQANPAWDVCKGNDRDADRARGEAEARQARKTVASQPDASHTPRPAEPTE